MTKNSFLMISFCSILIFFAGCGDNNSKSQNLKSAKSDLPAIESIDFRLGEQPITTSDTAIIFGLNATKNKIYASCVKEMEYDPCKTGEFKITAQRQKACHEPEVRLELPMKRYQIFYNGKLREDFEMKSLCVENRMLSKDVFQYSAVITIDTVSPSTYKAARTRLLITLKCRRHEPSSELWTFYKLEPLELTLRKLN